MPENSSIVLVGPMGAGKSTVGRALAELLNSPFVDSDEEIERRTGADIPWIFEIEGEAGFRDREEQVLADLLGSDPLVLATGGGIVMREANRELLGRCGFVVYLAATVKELVRRTAKDKNRPLLAGKDRNQVLSDLMVLRDPLYREVADAVLPTQGQTARKLAEKIASLATGTVG